VGALLGRPVADRLITASQLDALARSAPPPAANVLRGLKKLRAAAPKPIGLPQTTRLPSGARVQVYPGAEGAIAKLKDVTAQLAKSAAFAKLLPKVVMLVAPPKVGIGALPVVHDPTYGDGEGVVIKNGATPEFSPPTVAYSFEGVKRWTIGPVHELIHLLEEDQRAGDKVQRVFDRLRGTDSPPADPYINPHEMLAFFGSLYVTGYGDLLASEVPEVYQLAKEMMGNARVSSNPPPMTREKAQLAVRALKAAYQLGSWDPQYPWPF
jgi:hypothetical protein